MKSKKTYRTKVMVPEQTQTHDPDPVTEALLRVVREFDEYQAKLQEDNEKEVG